MPSKTATSKAKTVKSSAAKPAVKKAPAKTVVAKAEVSVSKASKTAARSVKADVVNTTGKVVESISLPGMIFGAKVNPTLMAQAVRVYLANQRSGTAATKSRGDVKLTTAKAWRQKGTGRARHGARSAPIFVGGGVAHGPKPHDFSLSLTKKMRRLSLFSALSAKLSEKEVKIVSGFEKLAPKTKDMASALQKVSGETKQNKVLLVLSDSKSAEPIVRISRNIDGLTYRFAAQLTTYEVLNNGTVVFAKDAVESLEKHYSGEKK